MIQAQCRPCQIVHHFPFPPAVGDSPPSQQLSQADNRWRLLCSNLLWMVGEDGHFVGCSVLVFGKLLDLLILSPRPPQDSVVRPQVTHRVQSLGSNVFSSPSQTMSPELKAALSILSSALQSVLQTSVLSTCDVDNLGIIVIDHVVVDILLLLLICCCCC